MKKNTNTTKNQDIPATTSRTEKKKVKKAVASKKVDQPKDAATSTAKTTVKKAKTVTKKVGEKSTKTTSTAKTPGEVRIVLQLRYHTELGQSIWVTGAGAFLSGSVLRQMYYEDHDHWRLELAIKLSDFSGDIHYRYHIRNADGSFIDDYQEKTLLLKNIKTPFLFVRDFWSYAGYHGNVYDKAPFDYLIPRTPNTPKRKTLTSATTHLFQVKVPCIRPDEGVCLLGEDAALGAWNDHQHQPLSYNPALRVWEAVFTFRENGIGVPYKYGIYDKATKEILRLESGDNRFTFTLHEKGLIIQNDGFINLSEKSWKGAGVNIPLFSIRTDKGLGIGDMGAIKPLVDWMSSVGLRLLQLLPINDTTVTKTWTDSYPYSAISVFALHPIYVDIDALLTKEIQSTDAVKRLLEKGKTLNTLPQVDYEAVLQLKWQLLGTIFPVVKKEVLSSADYKKFVKENDHWLQPYAAFSVLRDQYQTADFDTWKDAKTYTQQVFDKLNKTKKDKIHLYFYVQYVLSRQLLDAVQYAHKHEVVLKGDVPIGVDRHSVDVWQQPHLFDTDRQAGAPPDFFTKEGQNWRFPTYRWDEMEKDGYGWWKRRLSNMAQYFDAIRIDHVLGFFRIWSIPVEQEQGLLGYFQPSLPIDETEFAQWNIPFDYDRYCTPFINTQLLVAVFGDDAAYIKTEFLDCLDNATYRLKPAFDTQNKIRQHFDALEKNEQNSKISSALLQLVANVILIPDAQPGKYHCRFALYETSSYQYLSDWEKRQLYYLYLNYYFERQDDNWRRNGLRQLSAVSAVTNMMICGEDLGMVPKDVSSVLGQLGFLGLKVQRMSSHAGEAFSDPETVGFLNVVTPSTHDMLPLRNWWNQETLALKDLFYATQLHEDGFPPESCNGTIVEQIVFRHLVSPALWSVFLIQDLLGMDAATTNPNTDEDIINRPEVARFYWRYRMHLSVEKLQKEKSLNGKIKNLLQLSNR
ncbi:MAG: 4-alpha-glucanotransferase [Chitinophagaceae bacterium]